MLLHPREEALLNKELLPQRPLISEDLICHIITQFDEPNGIRSCRLTAQLNAFILTSQINRKEAKFIQKELSYGLLAAGNWRPLTGHLDGFGWTGDIEKTSWCIRKLLDRDVFGYTRLYDGQTSSLVSDLDNGYCAVVSAGHARTILKTAEGGGDYYVCDPLMGVYNGYYNEEDSSRMGGNFLESMQNEQHYFIV